jgi:hypothetical protein
MRISRAASRYAKAIHSLIDPDTFTAAVNDDMKSVLVTVSRIGTSRLLKTLWLQALKNWVHENIWDVNAQNPLDFL